MGQMNMRRINDIPVHIEEGVIFNKGEGWNELDLIVKEAVDGFKALRKEVLRIEITKCDDNPEELQVVTVEKSSIRRIRRITGYLSTEDRFSDAKKTELLARRDHTGEHKTNYLREV